MECSRDKFRFGGDTLREISDTAVLDLTQAALFDGGSPGIKTREEWCTTVHCSFVCTPDVQTDGEQVI